jgi:DNA-binding GntR family transcriptional regulator
MAGRRADEEPLYRVLADVIRDRVRSGRYAVGDQIPTEHEICVAENVSRTTVRQAVQALVSEGVLDRQQGRGTFVTAVPAKRDAFFQPLPQSTFHFTCVEAGWSAPSFEIATAFGVPLDQPVFSMTRLRMDGDRPVAVTRYFTAAEALRARPMTDLEHTDVVFDVVLRSRDLHIHRSNIMAELVEIGARDADLLEVPVGVVSIGTQRVGFDERGRALRLSRTIMHPSRAKLFWSIRHRGGAGGEGGSDLSVWAGTAE